MNVSLTPPLEQYVQAKVDSGLYSTASEVIRAGLRAMIEQGIEAGLKDSAAGRVISSKQCFDEIRKKLVKEYGAYEV